MSKERISNLTRSVTEKNVQVKPVTQTPISSFAPPKPVRIIDSKTRKSNDSKHFKKNN